MTLKSGGPKYLEPLITHSWSNIEGLSTIWNTCDLMLGTADSRAAGDDDSFYTDTPLSPLMLKIFPV